MARYNKAGVYSWEVKRLGVLPLPGGGGPVIGQSPTGPIQAPAIAPSSGATIGTIIQQLTSASGSAASDIEASSVAAMNDYARFFPRSMLSNPGASQTRLRTIGRVLSSLRSDSKNVMDQVAATLAPLNEWERWMLSRRFTYRGTSAQFPDPCPTPARCHTSVELLLADLSAHVLGAPMRTPNILPTRITYSIPPGVPSSTAGYGPSSANLTPTGGGGMTQSSVPAVAVIDHGGSGAAASAVQTQTVLDENNGSGITPIVPATGPSDSIPGYGVNPVLNDGSSSTVSGLPSWWKPALAVAIGAAVGVGVGRMIAR